MKSPIHFGINNRLFINLLGFFIIFLGLVTLPTVKRTAFPSLSYDLVQVTTLYPGATPKDVEKLVTIPLEEEINEVDGIKEMTSVSAENMSIISIEIDPDESDKQKVVNNIQRAVDRERDLPEDAEDPLVEELETKNEPVLEVSLSSNSLTESEIRQWGVLLEDKLLDIPGIASISRAGFRDPEIWVEVDPAKLTPYYLSLEEVIDALRDQNVTLSGGTIQSGHLDFVVRTLGEFETPKEIAKVVIRANDQGRWIQISDVATVRYALEEATTALNTNGELALNLIVIKKESGDILHMVERVKETIKTFQKIASPELKIDIINDFSYFVNRRLRILISNGLLGGTLVTLLLFGFMRASIATVTLVDLVIVGFATLLVITGLGIPINLISMFGFILVFGMLCDDAIVVSENTYRLIENGMPPKEAALEGAKQVVKPVLASIATTLAAFSPLFFMSGTMGKFIFQIPLVVCIALLISVVDAFLILPGHLSHWVKHKTTRSQKEQKKEHWFEIIKEKYGRLVGKILDHKYKAAGLIILIFVATLILGRMGVKFVLFSSEGIEQFFLKAEAPIGTSLAHTKKLFIPLEKAVASLSDKELEDYVTLFGVTQQEANDPFTLRGTHLGQIRVFLTPSQSRKRNAKEIIEELREATKDVPGLERIYFDRVQPGPPVGKAVMIRIQGEDYKIIREIAGKFEDYLATLKGVTDIRNDYELGKQELRVVVDEKKAAEAGLTMRRIAEGVRNAFEGGIATTIKTTEEEIDVRVKWRGGKYMPPESLEDVLVRNRFNLLVPISRVAHIEKERGLTVVRHLDRDRVVSVSADIDDKHITSLEANRKVMKAFKNIEQEYPGYRVKYGGEQEDTAESMQSFKRAFLLAFLLIFAILCLQFKSLVQPIVVMLTIPLGITGVIIAFFVHGVPLGFMSILGLVALSGVVVNNSLIILSFINNLRHEGEDLRSAIIKGTALRLRAIIITTLTTASGTMPLAYGLGGNDPFIKPMALAFTWGLLFSTALTLLVIPCFYAIAEEWKAKLKEKFTKMKEKTVTEDAL